MNMKSNKAPNLDLDTIMPLLISQWRKLRGLRGPEDKLQTREFRSVVLAIKALQERFKESPETIGYDYFSDPELLAAYILYEWVIHYQEGLSLINELPHPPKRVLDVCSGPAPYAFAALRHGAEEVIATDRNLNALAQGAEICGRYGYALTIRKWNCINEPMPVEGKFDLIILAHSLAELFPTTERNWKEKQHQFINSLLYKLEPEGHLLLVDNSFLPMNHRILALRDDLVKEGVPIQAPCVWKKECPALRTKNSPCYAQREFVKPHLIKEIHRAGLINLNSLKMTYIIFKNPKALWPQLPEKNFYRIISPPVETHHGKLYYLCGVDGKKQLTTRLDKQPKESRAFEYLQRGELISVEGTRESGGYTLNIVEGTSVQVEAACGKAIPEITA